MKHRMIIAVVVAFSMVGSAAYSVSSLASEKAENAMRGGGRIEGTWRVAVTLRNCQTGSEIRSFPAMLTFVGGVLTGTTTAFPVALRGPDHGVWEYEGHRRYRAVSEAFLFNSAGAWVSTQRITQNIELNDGNRFTSEAAVEFFDTAGNTTSSGCATAVATRME